MGNPIELQECEERRIDQRNREPWQMHGIWVVPVNPGSPTAAHEGHPDAKWYSREGHYYCDTAAEAEDHIRRMVGERALGPKPEKGAPDAEADG